MARRFGPVFELMRAVLGLWFRLCGWKIEGQRPSERHYVIIAAPHTSNWDFPLMLAIAMTWRIRLMWLGKVSLFRPPFGWLMRRMGGIAVDRSRSNDMVERMLHEFSTREDMVLAIPPEGTRKKVNRWRTGFYHIALGANVPIALGFLDYRRKAGGIIRMYHPTGDMAADMAEIRGYYADISGKYPDQ